MESRSIVSRSDANNEDLKSLPYCDPVESKYEVTTRIGKGTFGEVFKAKHKITGQEVALKKILLDNEQEGFPITAIREIKILKSYNHENTVELIEVCRSSETIQGKPIQYLVFNFCHHDLAGLIQESHDKIKSPPLIKCIVKQLCEGIHQLHTNKILHRDMKSSNILITKHGVVKIADFGLARPIKNENALYTNRVVTLWYRPPELLLGERCYTKAVDLWGIGCIAAELYCKEPIMKGETENKQLSLIADYLGPITPEVWPTVDKLPLYAGLSKTLSRPRRKHFFIKMKQFTQDQLTLQFFEGLLALNPSKRFTSSQALDHEYFFDEKIKTADISALAESLASISQSKFEFTTRKRPPPDQLASTANHDKFMAQQMVKRGNNHRSISHRPGPSNNDGQYRDHVY